METPQDMHKDGGGGCVYFYFISVISFQFMLT